MQAAMTPPIDRLVSLKDGFGLIGVRKTKGYAEVSAGRLKVVRNGKRTYIRASEIERYILALEAASQQEAA